MRWIVGLLVLLAATAAVAERTYIYRLRLCGETGGCAATGSAGAVSAAPVSSTGCELAATLPCTF